MKNSILWLLALSALAGGAYWTWTKRTDPLASRPSGAPGATRKSSAPTTAVVATRNINFAITAAGEIGPLGAVFADQDDRYVYVKRDDGHFERRSIQLGVSDYDYAEVTKGLSSGEVVSLVAPPAGETSRTTN